MTTPDSPSSGRFRAIAAWTLYPLLVGSVVAASVLSVQGGAPIGLTLVVAHFASLVTVVLLERAMPFRREWLRSYGDSATDLCHFVFSDLAVRAMSGPMLGALAVLATWFSSRHGFAAWPTRWPLALQLALALLIAELSSYWFHRLEHTTRLLWRLHSVHHSAPRLYFLNQSRNHPLDNLLGNLAVLPIALLGAGGELFVAFGAFTTMHLLLQHSNIELRHGWLNFVVSSAELHRWHHSRRLEEANCNYGVILIVCDVLFRTRIAPRPPPCDVGLPREMAAFPQSYLGQLWAPFRPALFESVAEAGPDARAPSR
jgi:sterol desaturase/sphingolipid hydroxylase (fatty acid hydroxylase superfamily)